MILDTVKQLANEQFASVLSHRRHFHTHPELSFLEFETSAFIKNRLSELDIAWQPVGETGILATIPGDKGPGRCVALRADMDALPINESGNKPYKSSKEGIMHACGHDVHMASLLGTAAILQSVRKQFAGTIKLIFQPAEEVLPGGAQLMIEKGVLRDPEPDLVLGQHVYPGLPAGQLGFRRGHFMASMDELFVTVKGRGGHAAQPHSNIDPVMMTAQLLVTLQQIVSRFANPAMPTVLSFGKVNAKGAINIIPDEVILEGTFRTMNEEWRATAHDKMKSIADNLIRSLGGHCSFEIRKGYPVLINDPQVTRQTEAAAVEYLGRENIVTADLWMAAEDFARYAAQIPSCFYLIGTGNASKGISASLHSAQFDIDEEVLRLSTGIMAYAAIFQLGKMNSGTL